MPTSERAVVLKNASAYDGVPGVVGAHIPWQPKYERLAGLGYLAKQVVDEDDLKPCKYHPDLCFVDEAALEAHVTDDKRRIVSLRDALPELEKTATRYEREAEELEPMPYQPPHSVERDRERLRRAAADCRRQADRARSELAALGIGEDVMSG